MSNFKMVRDILIKLLEKEELLKKSKHFTNKALKNHKINKEIKTEDLINMKNSILDEYNNNQIYPKEYKTDSDNELLNLIVDKIQNKYDPIVDKDLDMQDIQDYNLLYWKFKNGDL